MKIADYKAPPKSESVAKAIAGTLELEWSGAVEGRIREHGLGLFKRQGAIAGAELRQRQEVRQPVRVFVVDGCADAQDNSAFNLCRRCGLCAGCLHLALRDGMSRIEPWFTERVNHSSRESAKKARARRAWRLTWQWFR